jgi:hypothetical protein
MQITRERKITVVFSNREVIAALKQTYPDNISISALRDDALVEGKSSVTIASTYSDAPKGV